VIKIKITVPVLIHARVRVIIVFVTTPVAIRSPWFVVHNYREASWNHHQYNQPDDQNKEPLGTSFHDLTPHSKVTGFYREG
jgi:hypothetical protein